MKQNSMFVKWFAYISGVFSLVCTLFTYGFYLEEDLPVKFTLGFLALSLFSFHTGYNQKSKKQRKKELEAAIHGKKVNKKKPANRLYVSHLQGLPLSRFLDCSIIFKPDCFVIYGGGNAFELEFDKITEMSVSTDVQLHDQYVSDSGGAVAGGLAAGSIGAALGGGARSYTARNYTHYLIFTYIRNEEFANITFKVDNNVVEKAWDFEDLFIEKYKKKNGGYRLKL